MADPRKPVISPTVDQQKFILDTVHQHLLAATDKGAQAIGATGAAFVTVGMGVWTTELAELNGSATAKYLRALADIFDPTTNERQKQRAEKDRSQAVRDLYASLDLQMSKARGNG